MRELEGVSHNVSMKALAPMLAEFMAGDWSSVTVVGEDVRAAAWASTRGGLPVP